MVKRSILIGILFCILGPLTQAQPFGNEWINYQQTYYKLPVGKTGIYRITYSDLQEAGFPVNTVDPRRVQLFHRGVEQAIRVEGQLDARWDPGDYFEFYGQGNDGTLDQELYREVDAQPHAYYNLFSDTTAYFLTWRLDNSQGRRMQVFFENNVTGIPAESAYEATLRQVFSNNASLGLLYPLGSTSAETHLSEFDYGEGWTGPAITRGQSTTLTFGGLDQGVSTEGTPQLRLVVQGRNNRPHNVTVRVGPDASNLRMLTTLTWNYHQFVDQQEPLEWSDISGSGQLTVQLTANGVDGGADRISVSLAEVRLPLAWDLENADSAVIGWNTDGTNRTYAEIANVPDGARFYEVTDPNTPIQWRYNTQGGGITMVGRVTAPNMTVRMETEILSTRIDRIRFRNYSASADYLLISHPGLRVPTEGVQDPVQAYAAYRASALGGGHDTLVANVTELYNQFSYGEISPLAIQRFMAYQLSRGSPRYLFLVGKSRYWFNGYERNTNPNPNHPSWFPAAGYPGSDALYTYGMGADPQQPAVATGRLNARTAAEVLEYLNKVQEIETSGYDDPWRKRLLHLSGGANSFELASFARYIDQFAAIAENDFMGASVASFSKRSDAVVEIINVSETVNDGIGVLLMFGHSGAQRTDIDIGYVSNPVFNYDNEGQYPLILVNGCNAGDIFQDFETFGEDWVATPNKGASSVIAHAATGFALDLRDWSTLFYQVGFADSSFLGASIAEVMREVSTRFLTQEGTGEIKISQVQQMVLQGDPAVVLFGPTQPDVRVAENGASLLAYEGQSYSATADSLALHVLVENVGSTQGDTLWVSVQQTLPDGQTRALDTLAYPLPYFLDTLVYAIPRVVENTAGLHRFTISLDPGNRIAELKETNNRFTLEAFVPAGTHLNLLPPDFGVVSSTNVTLLAQANDLLAPARPLIFQLDTVATFSSPFLRSNTVNAAALLAWETTVPAVDSTVYYWRTRFADLQAEEDTTWQESSFVYVNDGEAGWAQVHPGQWDQNSRSGLNYATQTGTWSFVTNEVPLSVFTYGDAVPNVDRTDVQVRVNGEPYIVGDENNPNDVRYCRDNSVNALAFDRQSGFPYLVIDNGGFDIQNANSCGRRPQLINNFRQQDITGTSRELNRYVDGVADGDWVLLFTIGTVDPSVWPADVLAALAEIGVSSDSLLALNAGDAFVFLGQKQPDPSTLWESATATDSLETMSQVFGQFIEGEVRSPRIGPASQWGSLFLPSVALGPGDGLSIDVLGVGPDGTDTVLLSDVAYGTTDVSAFDTDLWPQFRLRAHLRDATNFTPPMLRQWWLSYTPPPEGILLPDSEVLPITVQEGEPFSFPFQFINISEQAFADSLTVRYTLTNGPTRAQVRDSLRIGPTAPGDTTRFVYSGNSIGQAGINTLETRVNESGLVPEQRLVNNALQLQDLVSVSRDSVHPLLDVRVDGRYILDGELVSPSPLVLVRLRDDNTLLRKTDTVGVQLFFKPPCEGCDFTRIAFTDPRVQWTPASEEQNFQLEFQPQNLDDGRYTLRVQATDATGNESGTEPYQVSFSVVNAATVTRFYPYPNPFSTSTRFVFTLTGSEVPDDIRIQILTISGKVVREITREELGPLHIGNNLTDFAWDGTDQWGQRLANGVYLYRVRVRNNGEAVDLNTQAADERAFTREYGKLYILR